MVNRFSRGGLERAVELNASALRQGGHQVFLAAHEVDPQLPPDDLVRLSRTSPGWIPFLLRQRPAVIIASDFSPVQYLSRTFGIPWVQVLQNCYAWVKPYKVTFVRRLLQDVSAIWPVSGRVRDYTTCVYGIPPERMRVITNPLQITLPPDPDVARREIRSQHAIRPDVPLLLFVGRLDPTKGLIYLVEALAHVRATRPDVTLVIVGEGDKDYCLYLEDRIRQLGLESQVRLVHWQTKVENWYAAADIFVLPSMFEGASLAAAEALACGLPCVLTRVGDADDLAEATGAVTLLDPPQGTYLDIHPHNYNQCLTAQFPDFSRQLAGALETTLENLPQMQIRARNSAARLQALRSPQSIARQMLAAITEI